ncbi:MAG: DoxX family protein [Candidatus Eisenbacteria sp.]|nr:DoxX family protein [Candidatus Eisenbacteria bacterium]
MWSAILTLLGITALAALAGYGLLYRLAQPGLKPWLWRGLVVLCRLVLAGVFLLAAIGKLENPFAFATSIYAYRVIPASLALIVGVVMPAIEILAAAALVSGVLWRGGAVVLGGMLIVFIAALFQAIVRGIDIDCGCFGSESSSVSFWLIARNYLLLLLALCPLVLDARRWRRLSGR